MSSLALIGLGSNLGDRAADAGRGDRGTGGDTWRVIVREVSSFHETEPVGGPPGQGKYLNAAAVARDDARPVRIAPRPPGDRGAVRPRPDRPLGRADPGPRLAALRRPDHRHARADACPIPGFAMRRFVLEPLAEIAPAAVDPVTKRTVAEILADLDR